MSLNVQFIYDFGSPNAYFLHRVIPGIEARTGVKFDYVPCLLGGIFKATGNQAPFLTFGGVKGKMDYERIEITRFVKKHGLSAYRFNKHFPVNTLLMMRAAAAAQLDGVHDPYIEAGMTAMWEQSRNMQDPEVFVESLTAAGLDGARLLERSQAEDVKEHLKANTAAAVERGAFGIPTVFVGEEMFFGKERAGQIEEEILAQLG